MTLQQTFITLSLLSQSFLCLSMEKSLSITTPMYAYWFPEKKFVDFSAPQYEKINADFKEIFEYDIPDIVVKKKIGKRYVYKAVPLSYFTENEHEYEIQDLSNTQLDNSITKEANPLHDIDTINRLHTTTEQLKKTITENKQLQKDIAKKQAKTKEIKEKIALHKKPVVKQNSVNNQQKKAIVKKQKIFTPTTINNSPPVAQKTTLPKKNPNTNHPQQKVHVLRSLFKKNNVQTEMQLKNKFSNECCNTDENSKKGKVGRYCTWKYIYYRKGRYPHELIINTDDCESIESSDESSSD